jgi:hypothetical protein
LLAFCTPYAKIWRLPSIADIPSYLNLPTELKLPSSLANFTTRRSSSKDLIRTEIIDQLQKTTPISVSIVHDIQTIPSNSQHRYTATPSSHFTSTRITNQANSHFQASNSRDGEACSMSRCTGKPIWRRGTGRQAAGPSVLLRRWCAAQRYAKIGID